MGVADLGLVNISGSLEATNLTTSRVAGTFAPTYLSGVSIDSGAPDAYGVQVNAVLTNVTLFGNSSYQFWTQNVVEYSTYSHELSFIDNVWNFSGPSGALSKNAILAHGPNGTQEGTTFYYALGPVVTIGYPFTLSLFLNAAAGSGGDEVYFNYTLSNQSQSLAGSYDFVEFNASGGSPAGSIPPAVFLADGGTYNPLGLPDDFEIDVVGPGGGSNFDALNASAAINLYYWSTTDQRFLVVPSAMDAGAETGETSAGLAATWNGNGDEGLRGIPGPAAYLGQGPSLSMGMWNVTPSTSGSAVLHYDLAPSNGFTFIAPGASPVLSGFGWAPPATSYDLPPGTYSLWSLASEFAPLRSALSLPGGGATLNVTLVADPSVGVYTPLWAFGPSALANIYVDLRRGSLYARQQPARTDRLRRTAGRGPFFPWFGEFNDFLFPVFPGLFLWHVSNAIVASPPSFEVTPPAWLANETEDFGTPSTNDLGLFFYDDANITLASAAAVGGWWFEPAYFGPTAPQYSVVFWNTSASSVVGNTFTTRAEGPSTCTAGRTTRSGTTPSSSTSPSRRTPVPSRGPSTARTASSTPTSGTPGPAGRAAGAATRSTTMSSGTTTPRTRRPSTRTPASHRGCRSTPCGTSLRAPAPTSSGARWSAGTTGGTTAPRSTRTGSCRSTRAGRSRSAEMPIRSCPPRSSRSRSV